MAEAASKVPVKPEQKASEHVSVPQAWRPFESLRREVDRLFEDFDRSSWRSPFRRSIFDIEPFWRRELAASAAPAVDIVERDDGYEIIAELPGMDPKNIDVKLVNGSLMIKGERQEEKEEKRKDYHLRERHFGFFERRLPLPEGIDPEKIEATFKNGVLMIRLPKSPEAMKPEKKIEVKSER